MMDEQIKRSTSNWKAMKSLLIYAVIISFLSLALKITLYSISYFSLFILELLLILFSGTVLIILGVLQKKNIALENSYLLLKNSIKGMIISSVFVYALTAFFLIKYGPAQFEINPRIYTNVFIILLIGGAIFFIRRNQTTLLPPALLLNKKGYIKRIFENCIYLTLLFIVAIIFTSLFNFSFFHIENINYLNISLLIILVNILCHYFIYSVYEWRLSIEKDSLKNNKNGIVSKTLIVFVTVYAGFALIKDLNHIIFTLRTPNIPTFVNLIYELDLLIFFYTTMLMIFVIFSLRKSLNNTYPTTEKLVNSAVTIWLIKLVNNGVVRINHELLNTISNYQTAHDVINQILTSVALVFNLTLLILGLFIISKNKFPNLKLWLSLAVIQVINFAFNITLPFWGEIQPGIKLYVNFALTILKLVFVILIINRYQNRPMVE